MLFILNILISLLLLNSLLLNNPVSANNNLNTRNGDKLQVVVSNTDIGPIANAIGGRHIDLRTLLPPGSDPHGFSLTQDTIQNLQDADLIILINSEFLHYEEQVKENYPDKIYLDFSDYEKNGLILKDFPNYQDCLHGYWLDWENSIAIGKSISTVLENNILPEYSTEFTHNLNRFEDSITSLQNNIKFAMDNSVLRDKKLVAAVPGVNYIIDNLGIEVGAVLLAEGSGFVSGGELAEIESKLSDGSYAGIVCPESMRDAKAGEISKQTAKDTGSKVYYVKFLATEVNSDYIATGYYNAMVFISGGGTKDDESGQILITYYIFALAISIIIALIEAFIIYRFKTQSEDVDESELFKDVKNAKNVKEHQKKERKKTEIKQNK